MPSRTPELAGAVAKVLLADDDSELIARLKSVLERELFVVESVDNGLAAFELAEQYQFDVVVLDWQMPGLDGVEVCRKLRLRGINVPVLLLTGKSAVPDKVQGLNAGADDYLTKPFATEELTARLRSMIRRSSGSVSNIVKAGAVEIDTTAHRVTVAGQECRLTPKEYNLLEALILRAGQVVSLDALLDSLWQTDSESTANTVRATMFNLRKKLGSQGDIVETVHGLGYRVST